MMAKKQYTREYLIEIMKKYLCEHDKITTREFDKCEYTPNTYSYRKEFGNIKNALMECGYNIPKDKQWLFDRKEYTKEKR